MPGSHVIQSDYENSYCAFAGAAGNRDRGGIAGRKCSKSDVVRERLQRAARLKGRQSTPLDAIADLIGSVDGLPPDLSTRKKRYLKATGYGQKRAR